MIFSRNDGGPEPPSSGPRVSPNLPVLRRGESPPSKVFTPSRAQRAAPSLPAARPPCRSTWAGRRGSGGATPRVRARKRGRRPGSGLGRDRRKRDDRHAGRGEDRHCRRVNAGERDSRRAEHRKSDPVTVRCGGRSGRRSGARPVTGSGEGAILADGRGRAVAPPGWASAMWSNEFIAGSREVQRAPALWRNSCGRCASACGASGRRTGMRMAEASTAWLGKSTGTWVHAARGKAVRAARAAAGLAGFMACFCWV